MPRKNPRRNISRIDVLTSAGHECGGWEVRIQRRRKKMSRYFSDQDFGGKRAALAAAKGFRDRMEESLRKFSTRELARTPSIRNQSGIVGVRLEQRVERRGETEYQYALWIAQWTDGKGRRKTRSFSINKFGNDEAMRRAVQARRNGLNRAARS